MSYGHEACHSLLSLLFQQHLWAAQVPGQQDTKWPLLQRDP